MTKDEAFKQLLEALDKELPHNMKHIAAGQRFNARVALAQPEQKDEQLVSNADELPNGFVPPERGPVAFLVEGLHKGKVIAHQLYFTVEEAQKTASVFAHHYPTVNVRSLIFGDTAPPQRKPLTKSQVLDLWEQTYVQRGTTGIEFARAIEAAHGIKENT